MPTHPFKIERPFRIAHPFNGGVDINCFRVAEGDTDKLAGMRSLLLGSVLKIVSTDLLRTR